MMRLPLRGGLRRADSSCVVPKLSLVENIPTIIRRSIATEESTFRDYLQASQRLQDYNRKEESNKSEKMFEAWSKAQQKQPISQGVAVVRTLAKQTKKLKGTKDSRLEDLQTEANDLLEKSALEYGHSEALVLWGNKLLEKAERADSREDSINSINKAMESYEASKAARGWFNLGLLLWDGYPDQSEHELQPQDILLPVDRVQAMKAFSEARALNDADALYFCGIQEINAQRSQNSAEIANERLREGLDWIYRAAEQGHGGANHYLALLHLSGHTGLCLEIDMQKFWDFLARAVEAGDGDALFLRGHVHLKGEYGRPVNLKAALTDFENAASHFDHPDAAVSAGAMYFSGMGSPENKERAFELYQHAGELGSVEGWRNVVSCYSNGQGVPRNESIARYIADTVLRN